jgi:hypothetical protein
MRALEDVVMQARKCMAHLVLLDVIDTPPTSDEKQHRKQPPSQIKNSLLRERLAQLDSFVLTNGCDADELRARVLFGNRAREISRTAAEDGIDLVIKHSEPGATDRAVAEHSPCPVLLYESDTQLTADTILDALPHPRQKKAVA